MGSPDVDRELERIRASADDAGLRSIRARAEENIAGHRVQREVAECHGMLARSDKAMEAFYRAQEAELQQTMDARREWERGARCRLMRRGVRSRRSGGRRGRLICGPGAGW